MPVQQLDHVTKNDPQRGLNIVQRRAQRNLVSPDPLVRLKGQVTQDAVNAARERLRNQRP